jgi:Mrp family chromosome partitioning ATPase
MAVLDTSPSDARNLALEAKRLGLIDLSISGDIVDIGLDRLDPSPVSE